MSKLHQRPAADAAAHADGDGAEAGAGFFSSLFQERGDDLAQPEPATWASRSAQVHAEPFDARRGSELFARLWGQDRHFGKLAPEEIERMGSHFDFALIPANQEVISQNEQGDYLVIVLEGTIAVDRMQPWGGRARLAEAHAGDMLGEMSLLDAGARFSACTTLTPVIAAVLDAARLDDMVNRDPRLALALLASLSRRLSLRLRQVSSRLSALLSRS